MDEDVGDPEIPQWFLQSNILEVIRKYVKAQKGKGVTYSESQKEALLPLFFRNYMEHPTARRSPILMLDQLQFNAPPVTHDVNVMYFMNNIITTCSVAVHKHNLMFRYEVEEYRKMMNEDEDIQQGKKFPEHQQLTANALQHAKKMIPKFVTFLEGKDKKREKQRKEAEAESRREAPVEMLRDRTNLPVFSSPGCSKDNTPRPRRPSKRRIESDPESDGKNHSVATKDMPVDTLVVIPRQVLTENCDTSASNRVIRSKPKNARVQNIATVNEGVALQAKQPTPSGTNTDHSYTKTSTPIPPPGTSRDTADLSDESPRKIPKRRKSVVPRVPPKDDDKPVSPTTSADGSLEDFFNSANDHMFMMSDSESLMDNDFFNSDCDDKFMYNSEDSSGDEESSLICHGSTQRSEPRDLLHSAGEQERAEECVTDELSTSIQAQLQLPLFDDVDSNNFAINYGRFLMENSEEFRPSDHVPEKEPDEEQQPRPRNSPSSKNVPKKSTAAPLSVKLRRHGAGNANEEIDETPRNFLFPKEAPKRSMAAPRSVKLRRQGAGNTNEEIGETSEGSTLQNFFFPKKIPKKSLAAPRSVKLRRQRVENAITAINEENEFSQDLLNPLATSTQMDFGNLLHFDLPGNVQNPIQNHIRGGTVRADFPRFSPLAPTMMDKETQNSASLRSTQNIFPPSQNSPGITAPPGNTTEGDVFTRTQDLLVTQGSNERSHETQAVNCDTEENLNEHEEMLLRKLFGHFTRENLNELLSFTDLSLEWIESSNSENDVEFIALITLLSSGNDQMPDVTDVTDVFAPNVELIFCDSLTERTINDASQDPLGENSQLHRIE